ncbi:MAG: hypothetical protein ACOY90_13410 [Candidatus Zhuqueibacterota bacterium]
MRSDSVKLFPNALLLAAVLLLHPPAPAQENSIKLKILSDFQAQNSVYRVEEARGFGLGSQMNFPLTQHLDFCLHVNYDYLWLSQNDVLDEWNWDYWEQTYIDFLPGTEPEIVNQTLRYTSTDSIYSATFEPEQRLKELRLFAGVEYQIPITEKLTCYAGLSAGVSLFFRELHMKEHWIKRFKVDTLSTEKFDYDYQFDLLHFAPTKKGTILFGAPSLGVRYFLNETVDMDVSVHSLFYYHENQIAGIIVSSGGEEWYPLKSKTQVKIGLTFKY